jgi:uncharacterized tellurite resistance protein B-like protein
MTVTAVSSQDVDVQQKCATFSAAFNKAQLTLTLAAGGHLHFIAWPAQVDWFSAAASLVATVPAGDEGGDAAGTSSLYAVEPSSLLQVVSFPASSSVRVQMWNVVHHVPLALVDLTLPAPIAQDVKVTTHKQLSKVFLCAGSQLCTIAFVPSRGALSQLVACAPAAAGAGTPTLSFAALLHHKAAVGGGKRAREDSNWTALVHAAGVEETKRARELTSSLAGGQSAGFSQLRHLGAASLGVVLETICTVIAAGKCTGGHRSTLASLLRAGSVSHALAPKLAQAVIQHRELEIAHTMLMHVQDLPEAFLVAAVLAPLSASDKRLSALLSSSSAPAAASSTNTDELRLAAMSRMLFQAVQCGRNDVALAAGLRELDMDCTGILLGCLLSLRANSPATHQAHAAALDWARLTIDAQLPRLGQAAKHSKHIKQCLSSWNTHVVGELQLCEASSSVAGPLVHVLEKAPVPAPVSGDYVVSADFF